MSPTHLHNNILCIHNIEIQTKGKITILFDKEHEIYDLGYEIVGES